MDNQAEYKYNSEYTQAEYKYSSDYSQAEYKYSSEYTQDSQDNLSSYDLGGDLTDAVEESFNLFTGTL
jgi:hypothetical protein